MEQTLNKENFDDFLSAIETIVKNNYETNEDLFGETVSDQTVTEIKELINAHAIDPHDSQKAHDLYYGIQKILTQFIPEGKIRNIIMLLKCNLLTEKEILNNKQTRGLDSRQVSNDKLEEVIDIIIQWSNKSYDSMLLAHLLLNKCKEKGISPKDRRLSDFIC